MARIVPSDAAPDPAGGEVPSAEMRTLERLRDGLDDGYTIYHGVHWARAGSSGSVYGEIDFIVANRFGRLLAIEQKDTEVSAVGGDLVARYGPRRAAGDAVPEPRAKSVVSQVTRNLNALRSGFSQRNGGRQLHVDHLLYLPASRVRGVLPSSVDPARVVDADRDGDLVDVVRGLLDLVPRDWSDADLENLPLVGQFLSRTVGASPHIGVLGRSARQSTTRLSGGLSTWAGRLSVEPWRLRVRGTAGSGKTQLALQLLEDAHAARRAALYVCFNRPLADAMRLVAPDPRRVVTFHELARRTLHEAGKPAIDLSRAGAFDEMAASFLALAPALAGTFATLVVDEGQDFEQAWADGLVAMARRDGRALWLEDPEQSLYDRPPVDLPGWACLSSPVNYRSPRLLVEFMNWLRLTDEPVEAGGPVPGLDPAWLVHDDDASPAGTTEDAVAGLLDQGFAPESIAVLSYRGLAGSRVAGRDGPSRLAGLATRRPAGYDASGDALWTESSLLVDTVRRFKGQAADAVVVTEIDFGAFGARERRRLFVALTRARLHAVLVCSERASSILQREVAG
ncbi:MAG: nuclease [Alphaproteobacteria bacterium]|nr:nuclease [Alphaproteobacteria bacterium]